jgi:glyceraldehyde-3-phosphate dehydrogenase type I
MKVAINGFGRIGRLFFRNAFPDLDIVAVNDVHGAKDAEYLLKYDSVYGRYGKKVEKKGKDLIVGGKKVVVLSERDPGKLPWKKMGVDVVIEATGAFREPKDACRHNNAGAKYVVITAPCKGGKPDLTIVPGVNDDQLKTVLGRSFDRPGVIGRKKEHRILSVASCTTNCLAPLVKVLDESFGLKNGFMTTVHAYTSSQGLVDGSAKKPARGRAAAVNIVPTTTGATDAVVEVLPGMKGKLDGMAIRVPVTAGSLTALTVNLNTKTTVKGINNVFKKISSGKMKGILEYSDEPLVSSDIVGNSHSAIFDSLDTQVNGEMVKVLAWYDNEFGYSCRVVDVVNMLKKWC